jgi:hypothetical protein
MKPLLVAPRRRAFNMTDLDFRNVAQDDPQFITYIRAVHLHLPSSPPGMRNSSIDPPPPQTKIVAKLLQFKVQSLYLQL